MPRPNTIVVTPTYNERDNLPKLVERVFALRLPGLEMVVVDDNSPDGTGEIADRLAKKHPITVIHRDHKEGFGPAYEHGFDVALAKKPNYIVHLDADLSHDPKVIPTMLEKIKSHDMVIGSRYTKDGHIERWGPIRRILSRGGNRYARLLLGMPFKDVTSGYKCWRADALQAVMTTKAEAVGYVFLIEQTHRAWQRELRIAETPITFRERESGTSKLSFKILRESAINVWRLRAARSR